MPTNLKRINYKFYSGFHYESGKILDDREAIDTGKSSLERYVSNAVVDFWLRQQTTPIVYFLTGLGLR